jgi:TetR/AcrR family transcriptional repressor of mexJK operon
MSATSSHARRRRRHRPPDPRVVRSRAAVVEAAKTLFLEKGFDGTTMEEVAARAGIAKRTVYNNYTDKSALFLEVVANVIAFAEEFARGLHDEFATGVTAQNLSTRLNDLAQRLAQGIMRPEVIALRRLLIGEAPTFPHLAQDYFDRAPGRVLVALASGFAHLNKHELVDTPDPRRAAEQFAYLIVGEPLDRAMLTGISPAGDHVIACAREGVETFLARYGPRRATSRRRPAQVPVKRR